MFSAARTLLLLGAAGLSLSACATTPGAKDGLRPTAAADAIGAPGAAAKGSDVQFQPPSFDASNYGLFLAGNAALGEGDSASAARYLSQLASTEDADPFIKERALTASLLAGDLAPAAKPAPNAPDTNQAPQRLGRLTKAVEAMAQGHGLEATTLLTTDFDGPPHGTAAALLAPWAAAMAGENDPKPLTIKAPDASAADLLARYSQAQLLERAKKYKEAETAYKELYEKAQNFGLAGLGYGEFLERRGRKADAAVVYDAML